MAGWPAATRAPSLSRASPPSTTVHRSSARRRTCGAIGRASRRGAQTASCAGELTSPRARGEALRAPRRVEPARRAEPARRSRRPGRAPDAHRVASVRFLEHSSMPAPCLMERVRSRPAKRAARSVCRAAARWAKGRTRQRGRLAARAGGVIPRLRSLGIGDRDAPSFHTRSLRSRDPVQAHGRRADPQADQSQGEDARRAAREGGKARGGGQRSG